VSDVQVLAVGTLEPEGRAGLGADIRTLTECGATALMVVTGIVVGRSRDGTGLGAVPGAEVRGQVGRLKDASIGAVKTGLLPIADAVSAVADELLRRRETVPAVIDPVLLLADVGFRASDATIDAYREELIPLARVLAVGEDEAELLLGTTAKGADAVKDLLALGPGWVVLRGRPSGGSETEDLVSDGGHWYALRWRMSEGDGASLCGFGAALATRLALGATVPEAAGWARDYSVGHRPMPAGGGDDWGGGQT
jgi:hydroxymethylpyrimidine/phosphomethylpyrimidine kinase